MNMIALQSPASGPRSASRSSAACTNCRSRRSRCIKPPGQKDCELCRLKGEECVTPQDDKRRQNRYRSRAYVESLEERLKSLEALLPLSSLSSAIPSPPRAPFPPQHISNLPVEMDSNFYGLQSSDDDVNDSSHVSRPHSARSVYEFLSYLGSPGNIEMQHSSLPRPEFPDSSNSITTNSAPHCNHTKIGSSPSVFAPSRRPSPTSPQILRDITPQMADHLSNIFWSQYNIVMRIVHRKAFEQDKTSGNSRFYSDFLEICILSVGLRYSESNRPRGSSTVLQISANTLCFVASLMADSKLDEPVNLPTIQGLLILADIHIGNGDTVLGRKYLNAACRLGCDLCLNNNVVRASLPDLELYVQDSVFCACVYADRNWSMFLEKDFFVPGESAILGIHQTTNHHLHHRGDLEFLGFETELELHIYEARFPFAAIVSSIVNLQTTTHVWSDHDLCLAIAKLDKRLNAWYTNLSTHLKWTPVNILNAPLSLLLLHQKYHSVLIILHQMHPTREQQSEDILNSGQSTKTTFSELSRTVCFNNAARIALIFKQYRNIFNNVQILATGIHPAGTAALALLGGKSDQQSAEDCLDISRHLQYLTQALECMAQMYPLAMKVLDVVNKKQNTG